nr:GTP 3',8-cyclase MoaA [Candidatus Bathyarchaeota archaeon]
MLIDPYGRPVNDLRISLTQQCNLNCFYCHHEGQGCSSGPKTVEMSAEEIELLVKVAASLGVEKIKLTGGEPLLYKEIVKVVKLLSKIKGIRDISMTTNGTLLSEWARPLAKAGLKRVNISLDTLSKEKYAKITGKALFGRVLDGIDAALKAGLKPVKLNMVLLKNVNESELPSLIDFSRKKGIILQVIELVVPDNASFLKKYHADVTSIERLLEELSVKVVIRKMHKRKKNFLKDDGGVELVKPVHNSEFCANCTRLRVTSDGKLKPCLMRNDNLVDVLTPMRKGASEEEIKKLFIEAVKRRAPYYR